MWIFMLFLSSIHQLQERLNQVSSTGFGLDFFRGQGTPSGPKWHYFRILYGMQMLMLLYQSGEDLLLRIKYKLRAYQSRIDKQQNEQTVRGKEKNYSDDAMTTCHVRDVELRLRSHLR